MTIDSTFATLAPIVLSSLSLILAIVSFVMNYRLNKLDEEQRKKLAEM